MAEEKDAKEKKKKAKLRHKIREQTIGYITAALGLVAGLAWNDAVRTSIEQYFPVARGGGIIPLDFAENGRSLKSTYC